MEKKKVLIVEDDGNIFNMLKNELDGSIYHVERAKAVDEAKSAVKVIGPFDCCVVDLQLLAFGLTIEEMDNYQDREGYALLKNYLWKAEKNPIQKSQTIICSKFIKQFMKEFRNEINGLSLVDKDKGFEKIVASLIKKICKS